MEKTPWYKGLALFLGPPSIPVIDGWQNTSYQPNDTVILECKALGGNPLPTLQWYRDGVPYRHEFRTFESIRTVISTIVINIEASDNNREYRCDAKNAALSTARSSAVKFQVRCKYSVLIDEVFLPFVLLCWYVQLIQWTCHDVCNSCRSTVSGLPLPLYLRYKSIFYVALDLKWILLNTTTCCDCRSSGHSPRLFSKIIPKPCKCCLLLHDIRWSLV